MNVNSINTINSNIYLNKRNTLNSLQTEKSGINSDKTIYKQTDIPTYALKSNYMPSFGKLKKVKDVVLVDKQTGDDVVAALKKDKIGDFVKFKIYKDADEAGYLDMKCESLFPENDYILAEPDNYIPEILHIRSLLGEKYEGIGTALIEAAKEESIKSGKNGCLWAVTKQGYAHSLSRYRTNENPIPFYYQKGFRAVDSNEDRKIQECLSDCNYAALPKSTLILLSSDYSTKNDDKSVSA